MRHSIVLAAGLAALSGCTFTHSSGSTDGGSSSSSGAWSSSGSPIATTRAVGDETFLDDVRPPAPIGSGSGCGGPTIAEVLPGGSRPGATSGRLSAATAESPGAAAEAADASVAHALSADGKTLYALSASRGLQLLDLSNVDAPVVAGRVPITGAPRALHVSGSMVHVVVEDAASSGSGALGRLTSRIWSVDVSSPKAPRVVSRVELGGPLVASRLVGHVLYSLTSAWSAGVVLASHDLRDPASPRPAARIDVPGVRVDVPAATALVELGDDRMTLASAAPGDGVSGARTVFQVFDLTDPDGAMTAGARFEHAGQVRTMHHAADRKLFAAVLVPSEWSYGATVALWSSPTPAAATPAGSVTPFAWTTSTSAGGSSGADAGPRVRVGQALIEGTRAWLVGDGATVYLVDTADPARAAASAPLSLPADFESNLAHARGDRLFVLSYPQSSRHAPVKLAVVDGATAASPRLVGAVVVAGVDEGSSSSGGPSDDGWSASTSDPARAFQVLDAEGLVAVPTTSGPDATRWTGRVRLVDVSAQALAVGGPLPSTPGARAVALPGRGGRFALLSAERLSIVDASARAEPRLRAELELASRVNAVGVTAGRVVQLTGAGAGAELRVTDAQAPDGAPLARVGIPGAWLMHQAGAVTWVLGRTLTGVDLADPLDPHVVSTLDLVAASDGAGGAFGYASEYAFQGTTLVVHRSAGPGGQPVTVVKDAGASQARGIGMLCGGPVPPPLHVLAAAAADTAVGHDLLIFDLSTPKAPRLAARVALPGARGFGLTLSGGVAWTMRWEGDAGSAWTGRSFTDAVDLSDPAHPTALSLNVPGVVVAADRGGKRFYTLDHVRSPDSPGGTSGRWTDVHALELTDRGTAQLVATVHLGGAETGFAHVGGRAYLTTASQLGVIELATMKLASQISPGTLQAVAGGKLFLSAPPPSTTLVSRPPPASTLVYGLADPDRPAFEQAVTLPGWMAAGGAAVVEGGAAYLPTAGGVPQLPLGP